MVCSAFNNAFIEVLNRIRLSLDPVIICLLLYSILSSCPYEFIRINLNYHRLDDWIIRREFLKCCYTKVGDPGISRLTSQASLWLVCSYLFPLYHVVFPSCLLRQAELCIPKFPKLVCWNLISSISKCDCVWEYNLWKVS